MIHLARSAKTMISSEIDAPEAEGHLTETLNRLIKIMVRRRWWVLLAASAIPLATIAGLSVVADRYTSEATLIAVQPQVSPRYVLPASTVAAADAFQAMTQSVLSQRQLLHVIDRFGLYGNARRKALPQQLVELMRRNITTEPLDPKLIRADFKVSFTAESPRLAMQVTSALCDLFIEENRKTQANVAASTTNFLKEQLDSKAQKLADQEQRLADFKTRYAAELPDQPGSLVALVDLRTQLQSTLASLSRAQQQRVILQSTLTRSAVRIQSDRDALLVQFTPKHPLVIKKEQDLTAVETVLKRLRSQSPGAKEPISVVDDPTIAQTVGQVEANELEIATLSADEQRLKVAIAQAETRLGRMPEREQQLAAVQRDYELLKQEYADLKVKQQQSELSADVDRQQEGQHFQLIDPPTLPLAPSSPKRVKISLGGLVGGIFVGFALAFLRDTMGRSLRTEDEVEKAFSAPIVIGIPRLLTSADHRAHKWRTVAECLGASALMVIVAFAEYYVYRQSSGV
jgi:polysaccharide biosynthesis transport protein